MKRKILKLFFCIIYLFSFVGCYTLSKMYSYREIPISTNSKIMDYIYIYTLPLNQNDLNTPVDHIFLKTNSINQKYKKVEILNDKVKIVYQGKEYYANVSEDRTYILIYKSNLNITGDFIIYLGKIKFDDKEIMDTPLIKIQKYVKVSKYNPIADGFNIDTTQNIYYGPVEGYKGR